MLAAEPPAKPIPDMTIHCPVRSADRSKTEVVCPSLQPGVEEQHQFLTVPSQRVPTEPFAHALQQPVHPFRGGLSPQVASARDGLVAKTEGVTEKVEALLRHSADPGLFRVHGEPDSLHDLLHLLPGFLGMVAAEDHIVVGVRYDVRRPLCSPSLSLPSQDP